VLSICTTCSRQGWCKGRGQKYRSQGFEGSREKDSGAGKMLKNYKELKVWQRAYQLCIEIYKITKDFPKEELYGLTSQIRRSVVSVPSNIAEGYGRKTTQEYIQALYIAYGSISELETQILLAGDLGYIKAENLGKLKKDMGDVERMLMGLIKSLEEKKANRKTGGGGPRVTTVVKLK
jgi:four helix bundle protein